MRGRIIVLKHSTPSQEPRSFATNCFFKAVKSAAVSGCERCDPLRYFATGSVINATRYCSTLDRLKEAIRRKRPRLLRRGVVLQHDNATPHSANLTQQWLQRYGWEILPHPAHSPDLAPSDFHLFGLH
ncbi:histone-lysine N-methyltransferase SETMAR [Plakobranchus ocellatus]|uniref:Histone-lysine N-methyltransferase SETMAR n=1 Tax=Plakobranchus ocellatus TaxID=259542 RepID=A0AAV4AW27_9GAST|nr:histone-lysine N-methyltransferase SETMAR [Plakobranchus ocellatus]